jgi:hypothetical protein
MQRVVVGKDWKLRNERGEVVGELEPGFALVIDTRIGGAPEGGRGTGGGSSGEDGQSPASEQGTTGADEQVALELPPSVVAREDKAAKVWAHYVATMNPRKKDLDPDTRKLINAALKVATVEECNRAISGCAASSFHMGENDRGRKYNQISQILKGKRGAQTTRERIDFFIDLAEKSGVQSGFPSGDAGRIRSAKQDIRDAHEMPGDDHIVERAKTSEEYLVSLGWRIERDETGWPNFVEPS